MLGGRQYCTYDPRTRVINRKTPTQKIKEYLHDPAGDLQRITNTHRTPEGWYHGRTTRHEDNEYTYDHNGNLTVRQTPTAVTNFEWDENDRLIAAETDGVQTTFGYDAQGRRVFKETNGTRTVFQWDGDTTLSDQVIENVDEETPDIKDAREFIFYERTFEPLALIETDKTVYFYNNDLIGLPHELYTGYGRILWRAEYDAHGKTTDIPIHVIDNPIRLQGQYYDEEIGLSYNRYRYYDPDQCAFIGKDPIRLIGGLNIYDYSPNVWGWHDPLGLKCGKIQNHHKVPWNNKTYNHQNHPLVKQAGENLKNAKKNQMPLGNHAGRHSPDYHQNIQDLLDEAYEDVAGQGKEKAQKALNEVYDTIEEGIKDKTLKPYSNKDVWIP